VTHARNVSNELLCTSLGRQKGGHMREVLAIVMTFCLGLFVTTILAYSLERRQLASNPVDMEADVRPGIISVSASGYASRTPEKPLPAQPEASAAVPDRDRSPAHMVWVLQPK
jgi:hypothetical protein